MFNPTSPLQNIYADVIYGCPLVYKEVKAVPEYAIKNSSLSS